MNILAIDIGSYSVKFLESKVTAKRINILTKKEVILEKARVHLPEDFSIQEIQFEIIENYLQKSGFEGKIIYQIPNEFTTSRYLEIPVNNKKKAEMMIPFQLDENLPFSSTQTHYTAGLSKSKNGYNALINITQTEFFEELYNYLDAKSILPALLTSELSAIHSFNSITPFTGYSCILDIGHRTTKAYFFHAGELVSNHISHIGGDLLDDVISKTYQIPKDEAIIYKHDNCFFLTDGLYDEVSEDQKNFATLMKQTVDPLIADIRRWDLGYRVKYGHSIEMIHITGGSSKIQNFENFLSQALSIQVSKLETNHLSKDESMNYNLSYMMAATQQSKVPASNFLFGKFLSKFGQNISLYSSSFIFARVLIICLIAIAGLMVERFVVLKPGIKRVDASNRKLLKSSSMSLSRVDQRLYKKKYPRLLKKIKKQDNIVTQEIKTIMSAKGINGLKSLALLSSQLTSNKSVDLIDFQSKNKFITAKFSSANATELEKLASHLKNSSLPEVIVNHKKGSSRLSVSFSEE